MEKFPNKQDIVEVNGEKYQRLPSGYTIREYFSHSTSEKGSGPGWDFRMRLLDKVYATQHCGRTFSKDEVFNPSLLPSDPFYNLVAIDDNE